MKAKIFIIIRFSKVQLWHGTTCTHVICTVHIKAWEKHTNTTESSNAIKL